MKYKNKEQDYIWHHIFKSRPSKFIKTVNNEFKEKTFNLDKNSSIRIIKVN